MNWTKERPMQPGWYWTRHGPKGHAYIVRLEIGMNPRNTRSPTLPRKNTLRVAHVSAGRNHSTVEEFEKGKFLNIQFMPCEWYGPIEAPGPEGGNDDLKAKIRMLSEFIKQAIDDRRKLIEEAKKLGIGFDDDRKP